MRTETVEVVRVDAMIDFLLECAISVLYLSD